MIGSKSGCAACHGEIFGAPVKLGTVSYHQKCFVCSVCKCRLQMSTYAMNKEVLFCQTCYRNVCLRNVDSKATDGGALGLVGSSSTTSSPSKPKFSDSSRQLQQQYSVTPPPPPSTAAPPPPPPTIAPASQRLFCHLCGAKVEMADAKFCMSCGAKFE